METTPKTVEIYSTPSCHFCHMAKEYFTAHNVPFVDYNVASDTQKRSEMLEKSGQLGVPVIIINNKDLIIGFDEERLAELLDIKA
jgi:glutaredoxin 3